MNLMPMIATKLLEKDYTIKYEHAIQLGFEQEVKYIWATNNNKEQYLKGIILKQFDGLVFKVEH